MEQYEDGRWINCQDCPQQFFLRANTEAELKAKGFPVPKRCVPCRVAKKEKFEDKQRVVERRKNSPFFAFLPQERQTEIRHGRV